MGGIGTTWRFRIAKVVSFRYPRLYMAAILKLFLRHLTSNGKSDELTFDGRYRGDMEIQNCLNRSVPISKMADFSR